MTFLHFNFTNVYRGLDNVALVVRPKPTLSTPPKALLVASHYDSAVCSHGGGLACRAVFDRAVFDRAIFDCQSKGTRLDTRAITGRLPSLALPFVLRLWVNAAHSHGTVIIPGDWSWAGPCCAWPETWYYYGLLAIKTKVLPLTIHTFHTFHTLQAPQTTGRRLVSCWKRQEHCCTRRSYLRRQWCSSGRVARSPSAL